MAAKAFSEQDRERIRQRLLARGRDLFSSHGLKKTSVADLTKAVGIAQGSFYLFFESKEDLFFAVLEEEEKVIKEQLFTPLLSQPLTRSNLKSLMLGGIRMMMENPLTRRLWTDDDFKVLLDGLPQERLAGHLRHDVAQLTPLIQHWQVQGQMVPLDPEVVAGVLGSLFFVSLHGTELGEKTPQVLEFMVDCLVQGLIPKEENHEGN